MAASYNPYEAPGTGGYGLPQNAAPNGSITPLMVEHMQGARPWIRLLSILCFVGAGFMVLAAGVMFLGGLVGLAASRSRSPGAELVGPLGGLMYLFMAGFYVFPGVLMHRCASAIDSFVTMPSSLSLEDALDKNRSYWKACGIMALVMIGLFVLMFVGAIVVGVAAGVAAKP